MEQDVSRAAPASSRSNTAVPDELSFGPLFRASRDAVVVGGADNRIIAWNPAAEQLYGYTRDEVIGQSFDLLIPEEAREEIARLAQSLAMATGSDHAALTAPIEMPARHKSGQIIYVEFSISLMEENGLPLGFATIRDCTERKRLEMERDTLLATAQETVRRAEELAQLKADLSSLIAHELGNPLGAISAIVELLERDDLSPDQRSQLLSSMHGEIKLLQRLVEDIRVAASMERGELSVNLEPTDLGLIMNEASTSCESLLANHDFALEPVPDVQVMADASRVSQVIRNLLSNASKYTPVGTPVRLRATQIDGGVQIDVEDEGPGITADDLNHIFTKFGRGRDESGRRIPGMGLGLFLSRQIARKHGGDLVATSEPGARTIFSFELQEAS